MLATSELYGLVQETPQTEKTPFYRKKSLWYWKCILFGLAKNYREAYNMFICNGILFNHGGERRGSTFCNQENN